MTNSEKLLQFKQLYITTNTLYLNIEKHLSPKLNVQDVDQIVANVDKMIAR